MKKCKHKHIETKNEEIGGYNIPDGCTTEYDIYCSDCGEYLGHWAYGSTDCEYWYNTEATLFQKIKEHIKDIYLKIKSKFENEDNEELPF